MATQVETIEADAARRERFLGRLRDWLAASDPGLSRLRTAARGMLSLLLTAAFLAGLTKLHPLPIAAYGLGVVIAFTGSIAVRDKTSRAQLRTRLYAFGAAVAAVFVSSLLAPRPIIADIAFLLVIFVAVYVRKFGQRWFAVGMIGFMSYFIGDYLRPLPSDIGWVAIAAAGAFVAAHVVSTVVLPDDPEQDFRRALGSIDRRINLILRRLAQLPPAGAMTLAERKPLLGHLMRLRDIVLMAEGFIPQGEAGSLAAAGAASDLAVALFELQLVIERMVRASFVAPPPQDLIRAVLYHDARAIEAPWARLRDDTSPEATATHLLIRVHRARTRLDAVLGPKPSPAFAPVEAKTQPPAAASPEKASPAGWVPADLRLPIQVTLACAIAIGAGLLLSQSRWYWAVITAFIVFNNTKSRADTATRALQRSAGTFAGLIGGTIAATLLHGNLVLSGAAIPLLFFLALYFLQVSYGVMIFFITVALALLYGLMGQFTPELLVLRLEETVIGALAGTLVAFLVFPARASAGAAENLDKYLTALGELVSAARRRVHGEEPQQLLPLSRQLDRSYTDLANAVRPLGGPWGAVTRFGEVRQTLLLLNGSAHWGRVLARSLRRGDKLEQPALQSFDERAEAVMANIARAEAMKGIFFDRRKPGPDAAPEPPRPPLPISEREDPTFALEAIFTLLSRAMRIDPAP
ncbi:MAG: putative transrane protein [Hyphomicrobiales bacterium]|nr:putative transrane protein [Hyphomicrobiales bacterium]